MKACEIRIIGGKFRGGKLHFPNLTFLRPTGNRIRETLFNWLQGVIVGKECLDLFAGSGALGFEALSRGASFVSFCETDQQVIDYLKKTIAQLGIEDQTELFYSNIPSQTLPLKKKFDLVFLDPPFYQNLIAESSQWLEKNHLLKPNSDIYIEAEASLDDLNIPSTWELYRSQKAGQVKYYLFKTRGK